MRNRKIIVGIIVTLGLSGLCQGSDVASLQRENDQLRRRVARLETALADLKTAAGANSSGPDLDGLRQENEQWQQRVRKLETMIATLNETVRAQSGALEAVQTQQGASHAEHAQALQTENDRLKQRMAGIEKEVAEIGKETKATPAPDTTAPVIQATASSRGAHSPVTCPGLPLIR
jgi:DNA repair exonuclease SbcCD ATPase subunit